MIIFEVIVSFLHAFPALLLLLVLFCLLLGGGGGGGGGGVAAAAAAAAWWWWWWWWWWWCESSTPRSKPSFQSNTVVLMFPYTHKSRRVLQYAWKPFRRSLQLT